jgi:hypothetical protein
MRYTAILVGSLASIVGAHSATADANVIVPQLLGGRQFLSELAARNVVLKALCAVTEEKHVVEKRQNTDGRCGPGFGK